MGIGSAELFNILVMNHAKKSTGCIQNYNCTGWNLVVFDGHFDCQGLHPFWAWNEKVDERKLNESLDLFMDQFHFDNF